MDAFETRLYSAVLITVVIIGSIIGFFALSVIRNQRKFVRLQRRYFLNEVSLLENERIRIAQDLHDELGPLLSLTKMLISDVKTPGDRETRQIEKANQNFETILDKLGEISINLTPSRLLKKGLQFALNDFFEDVREASTIDIQFLYNIKSPIGPELSIHLYRIIQEAVHNCLKHGKASRIGVNAEQRDRKLHIHYQDNGRGFDLQEQMENSTGLGLRSIKSRTAMLGGQLRYQSKEETGTSFFIEIPFHENNRN